MITEQNNIDEIGKIYIQIRLSKRTSYYTKHVIHALSIIEDSIFAHELAELDEFEYVFPETTKVALDAARHRINKRKGEAFEIRQAHQGSLIFEGAVAGLAYYVLKNTLVETLLEAYKESACHERLKNFLIERLGGKAESLKKSLYETNFEEKGLRADSISMMKKGNNYHISASVYPFQLEDEDMVRIPAGDFLCGYNKETGTIETDYAIDIYPVTNRQFAAFIKDKGYENDKFWSPEGLQWRTENEISKPEFWDDDKWNQPEHPVVGVSYYEAEAFAKWSGKALPTEVQWERAARGTDGRQYPWGDEFDKEKCNTKESGIGKTTRVTRYPNGISPDGCYDMAGNVWEWTASKCGKDKMVLRGGSWGDIRVIARCADRDGDRPFARDFNIGFRCVRT